MGRAYSTHWQEETPTGFWSGIFKDGYPSKVLDVDARIKMKYVLKERDWKVWTTLGQMAGVVNTAVNLHVS